MAEIREYGHSKTMLKGNIMGEHNCYKKDMQECIKKKVRELWEKYGCKTGCDQDYWLKAEKCVNSDDKKPSRKKETEVSKD
jgi:hypothetical protein